MQTPQQGLSTHTVSPHYDILGGMNYSSRPHRLGANQWRVLMNMCTEKESLSQVPLKKTQSYQLGYLTTRPFLMHLCNIPTPVSNYGTLVGLTEKQVLRLTDTTATALKMFGSTFLADGSYIESSTAAFQRWGTCLYNDRLFFVNELNEVRYTDGARVFPLNALYKMYALANNGTTHQHTSGAYVGTIYGPFSWRPSNTGTSYSLHTHPFTWTGPTSGTPVEAGWEYHIVCTPGTENRFKIGDRIQFYAETSTEPALLKGIVLGGVAGSGYIHVEASNTVASVNNNYTSGTMLYKQTTVPKGRYVQVFYDHLVVGAPIHGAGNYPNSVMWSNLNDFTDFEERSDSEADFYHCVDYQSSACPITGITGMQLLKNYCAIYTPTTIYLMSYTGLPRVMNVNPAITDYGCGLKYSVISLDNNHAFYDTRHGQFMVFDGGSVQPIGGPIINYFNESLTTDIDLQQRTFGYVDYARNEAVWCYISVDSASFYDKAVVFNYGNRTWSVRSVENTYSFCHAGRKAKICSDVTTACNTLTNIMAKDLVASTGLAFDRVWGTRDAALLQEEVSADALSALRNATVPYLETGDYFYDSLAHEKEIHAILLNATATSYAGVKVEISGRKHIDDTVSWTNVGTWTSALETEFLTFVAVNGKIIRFKFTPVAVSAATTSTINPSSPTITESRGGTTRGFVLTAFEPMVVGIGATK